MTPRKAQRERAGRKPGGKANKPASEHQCAVNRENASKPRIHLPEEVRRALTEAKGRLGEALAQHGVPHICRIIEDGPSNELFQWATDFAADRGGMPRRREEQIEAHELPPMVIEFKNFHPPNE